MSNESGSQPWQPATFDNLSLCHADDNLDVVSAIQDEAVAPLLSAPQPVAMVDHHARELYWIDLSEQARQLGYQEGFSLGKQEGREQGFKSGEQAARAALAQEISEQKRVATETITQWVANFQHELNLINEKIVPTLVNIAIQAAQKIVGALPDQVDKQLTLIIQALINQYPPLGDHVRLHVNPNDVSLVGALLADELASSGWKLVIDHHIESGGCKIISERTEIDATVANKWSAIMAIADNNRH